MSGPRHKPSCFKAYDVRGRVPAELDDDLARRIGLAVARREEGGVWAVGRDCRLSSAPLAASLGSSARNKVTNSSAVAPRSAQ